MKVKTLTLSLTDEQGRQLNTTVDIPQHGENLSLRHERLRKAVERVRTMIGPRAFAPGADTTTFSMFYLAEADRILREALK
jgi:hypothetical protein